MRVGKKRKKGNTERERKSERIRTWGERKGWAMSSSQLARSLGSATKHLKNENTEG